MSAYLKQKRSNRKTYSQNDRRESTHVEERSNCTRESLLVHENRSDFKEQDLFVPWKTKTSNESQVAPSIYHRFYHVFKEGELEKLLFAFPTVHVVDAYYDEGNWCALFKKNML